MNVEQPEVVSKEVAPKEEQILDFKQMWKDYLNKEYDTYTLQVGSLRAFLKELGYEIKWNEKDSTWHIVNICKVKYNPEYISLDTAVSLHNGCLVKIKGNIVESLCKTQFVFSKDVYTNAHKAKMVESVYLQRKKGEWKTQKNMVRFVDEEES